MKALISFLLAAALVGDKAGDGNDDEHIGKACVRDEDLGAVQLPVVALVNGEGSAGPGAGTGTGLGQAEPRRPTRRCTAWVGTWPSARGGAFVS